MWDEQEQKRNEADTTRLFWESSGHIVELLRSPERRLIRESRSHSLSVLNSGRFSSHWFVLFTDIFVHVSGGSQNIHPLTTVWVDVIQDTDTIQVCNSHLKIINTFLVYVYNMVTIYCGLLRRIALTLAARTQAEVQRQ
jgi:amyotrophic lateral sclerosis 2 protein